MALWEKQNPHIYLEEDDHDDDYSGEFDSDCDSDMDPTHIILEENLDQLSDLSITKKSNPRIDKDQERIDEKSFQEVRSIIEAGKLEKLKVEQCKVYLRKNGLRLTGKKETLIQRIKEHHEILSGGGEKKYPVSSFVLNCKGDACTGDVVMFEQNVYEMYNIVSRSASGSPCGTRIVVGRIVKESYGAAKQQHTFTIEVLWSKGEKPLPPLHPLLIKGRNLYRLKTLRQKWEDEKERQKILMEKHSRGSLARCDRESRIQEKETRKALRENKGLKMETKRNQSQLSSTLKGNQGIQTQQLGSSVNCEEAAPKARPSALYNDTAKQTIEAQRSGMPIDAVKIGGESQKQVVQPRYSGQLNVGRGPQQPAILHQHLGSFRPLQATLRPRNSGSLIAVVNTSSGTQKLQTHHQLDSLIDSVRPTNRASSGLPCQTEHKIERESHNFYQVPGRSVDLRGIQEVQHNNNNYGSWLLNDQHHPVYMYPSTACGNGFSGWCHHRQPLTSMNHNQQQKECKFYAQGRCYFGANCKYLHD